METFWLPVVKTVRLEFGEREESKVGIYIEGVCIELFKL